MKKIFLICFTLIASTLIFCACHTESMDNIVNTKGELKLSSMKIGVDMDVDVVYLESRAESGVDLSNYIVTIYDQYSQQAGQWTYSEMPEIVSLAVGTYTVEVKSAAEPTNGFDVPYYEGIATCEIKENQVTDVPAISCKLANMLFTVEYDESFQDKISEDVVTTITIGENSLQIPASESRKAYLIAPDSETASMEVNLKGTIDGESVTEVKRVENVQAGQYNIIKYVLSPVDDGNNSVGGNLNIAINIDSSMTSSDETVGVNPGEEPGIDDFPTDGGEEPGDGDGDSDGDGEGGITSDINITGKKLGESPFFDIDQTQTITGATTLIVGIEAPAGIQNLKVTISSDDEEFNGIGEGLGEFDLAHSDSMNEDAQAMLPILGLPIDDAVLNQTNLDFNISKFTSMLAGFKGTHTFKITVTDNQGKTESKSLVINVPKK